MAKPTTRALPHGYERGRTGPDLFSGGVVQNFGEFQGYDSPYFLMKETN